MLTDSVKRVTSEFLTPLCDATEQLFRPLNLEHGDRLRIALDKEGKNFITEVYGVKNDIRGYCSYYALKWQDRIPERKQLGYGKFSFAATDFTALIINALWPEDQIVFDDEAAETTYRYILTNFAQQHSGMTMRAEFKKNGTTPKQLFIDNPELPLAPYQGTALLGSIGQEGAGLFMEQGTGKTPVVIGRICNEARKMQSGIPEDITRKAEDILENAEREATRKADELVAEAETKGQSKLDQLKHDAIERAKHRKVNLDFEGTTEELLIKTQEAIAVAKRQAAEDLADAETKGNAYKTKLITEAKEIGCILKDTAIKQAHERIATLHSTCEKKARRMYRALIVAPKNVRANWKNEFLRFASTPGRLVVLRGGALERTKLLIEAFQQDEGDEWTAVICSYETLIRSWDSLKMVEWDLAVLDESHYIKSPSTKRFKQSLKLRELCKQRMVLTGTPITNSLLDLYTQLEFLGEGFSGFHSFTAFRQYYSRFENRGGNHDVFVGYKNVPLIQERLARMAFMIRKEEALPDLPEKVNDIYEVEMSKEQYDIYCQVRDQLAIEIENDLNAAENKSLVINNILTKLLRLAQITSGFIAWDPVYSDEGDIIKARQVDRFDPNPKLEALVELLKEKGPNDKTVVWACWVQDIKSIKARLDLEGIDAVTYYGGTSDEDREEAVRRFNCDPNCKVFIGNPAAGGTGINLLGYDINNIDTSTTNANHVIHYSQDWSMVKRAQCDDRCHRRGTRQNVRYTDLCVPGSIDEEIRARVLKKRITAYAIQDVRDIFTRVLNMKPEVNNE